jgi:CHAT domain-containing protein
LALRGPSAWAQGDPIELQKRAIQRIDDFTDQFRKTGDFRSRIADLAQAEGELAASNRILADRQDCDDGKLTAAEMFGLPLDKSRLVVLSACETGRAEATHANEVLGMVRALIYAGAGTLILSYWEVDSAATALWMETFYEAARSRPLPEAARAALTKVKSHPSYRHPYYWAAFAMIGR